MISVFEIGVDGLSLEDSDRRKLQKDLRIRCSKYLKSYYLVLYSRNFSGYLREEKVSENLTVYYTGGNRFIVFFRILKLGYKLAKHNKIDLITALDPFTCGLVAYLLKLMFKIPINVQMHFDYFSENYWDYFSYFSRCFSKLILNFILPRCDSFRVVSNEQKRQLLNKGLGNKLIEVIPTPIDLGQIVEASIRNNVCEKFRKSPNTKLLLYVGRLEWQKDLITLIKAVGLVKKQFLDVRLIIIGIGSLETQLRVLSRELAIEDDIIFLGSIQHQLLYSFYYSCDIFVISSRLEGRGVVVSEAAMCRMPTVATRFTGSDEQIINGKTGFIVDIYDHKSFSDKILVLLNNASMAKEFGNNAYDFVNSKNKKINDIHALVSFWEKTAALKL